MTERLAGRVVATTRDGDREDQLTTALQLAGAEVKEWPTLAFSGPRDETPLREALARLESFDWLVFTSARAVPVVAGLKRWPGSGPRVAAVGERTAEKVRSHGWPVDLVGEGDGAAGLLRRWRTSGGVAGARILYPAGSLARPELEEGLTGDGATVVRVEAYQTLLCPPDPALVRRDLERGVDVVVFTSPSAVDGLSTSLGGALPAALDGCAVVASGRTTEAALGAAGVERVTVAEGPTADGLVDACVRALTKA